MSDVSVAVPWKITQKKFELVKNATSCPLNYMVLDFFLRLGKQSMSGFWSDHLPAPPALSGLLHRLKHTFFAQMSGFPGQKDPASGQKSVRSVRILAPGSPPTFPGPSGTPSLLVMYIGKKGKGV